MPPTEKKTSKFNDFNFVVDNLGRFSGHHHQQHQQEALSLCTGSKMTPRSKTDSFSGSPIKQQRSSPVPSGTPKSSISNSTHNGACGVGGSPSASSTTAASAAFNAGVGNMSISMQPKNSTDLADVLSFLNQFLNQAPSNVYKCNINVTVNISK